MKIYTKVVSQWDDEQQRYVTVEEESYNYNGPIAECKGGGSQTTTTEPWDQQKPYLLQGYQAAQNLYNSNTPSYYPGSTVAPQSAATLQSQQGALQTANSLAGPIGQANSALGNLLGAADLSNNPYIDEYANAATQPIMENLQQHILPGISSRAIQSGAYGGGRQGLLEGEAIGNAQQTAANTRAGIYNNAYNQGLNAMASGLQLSPSIANLGLLPSQIQGQVGAQQNAYQQALLNANIQRFNFGQNEPGQKLANYMSLISGGGYNTQTTPLHGSSLGSALGGGLAGAATGAQIGTALGGPGWGTAIGGGIGLLGGFL